MTARVGNDQSYARSPESPELLLWHPQEVRFLEPHLAAHDPPWVWHQIQDRVDEGRFARCGSPHNAKQLASDHLEVDPLDSADLSSISGIFRRQATHVQQSFHQGHTR